MLLWCYRGGHQPQAVVCMASKRGHEKAPGRVHGDDEVSVSSLGQAAMQRLSGCARQLQVALDVILLKGEQRLEASRGQM